MVEILRQKKTERRERFRMKKVKPEGETLRQKITKWVAAHHDEIVRLYEEGKFKGLEDFRDRTIDITQPLSAILEVATKADSNAERTRQQFLDAVVEMLKVPESAAPRLPCARASSMLSAAF